MTRSYGMPEQTLHNFNKGETSDRKNIADFWKTVFSYVILTLHYLCIILGQMYQ